MFNNTDDKSRIVYVCAPCMSWLALFKLKLFILFHKDFRIAFDMKNVIHIKEDFFNVLKMFSGENKLSIFNMHSDIMVLMMLRSFDKNVDIYADETDFYANSRALVNRKFKVF